MFSPGPPFPPGNFGSTQKALSFDEAVQAAGAAEEQSAEVPGSHEQRDGRHPWSSFQGAMLSAPNEQDQSSALPSIFSPLLPIHPSPSSAAMPLSSSSQLLFQPGSEQSGMDADVGLDADMAFERVEQQLSSERPTFTRFRSRKSPDLIKRLSSSPHPPFPSASASSPSPSALLHLRPTLEPWLQGTEDAQNLPATATAASVRRERGREKASPSVDLIWAASEAAADAFVRGKSAARDGKSPILLSSSSAPAAAGAPSSSSFSSSAIGGDRLPASLIFEQFAETLLDALRGPLSFAEALLQFEAICRETSDRLRDDASDRARPTEAHVLRARSAAVQSEAATWRLVYHLLGYELDTLSPSDKLSPAPAEQEAFVFIENNETAQLCLRVLQWLQSLAAARLDSSAKHRGSAVSAYSKSFGLLPHTKRTIQTGASGQKNSRLGSQMGRAPAGGAAERGGEQRPIVSKLDFDATTREGARLHVEDEKFEEQLLEDTWQLLIAGRIEEAKLLCESAGQPWRASLLDLAELPSAASWRKKIGSVGIATSAPWNQPPTLSSASSAAVRSNAARAAQSLDLERGQGEMRRRQKWASFCASQKVHSRYEAAVFASMCGNISKMLPICLRWEEALWATVKAWLDTLIDCHLAGSYWSNERSSSHLSLPSSSSSPLSPFPPSHSRSPTDGWLLLVAQQQPSNFADVFSRLRADPSVAAAIRRASHETHHTLQALLILRDTSGLISNILFNIQPRSIMPAAAAAAAASPSSSAALLPLTASEASQGATSAPPEDPDLLRCGAHLVLLLRYLLPREDVERSHDALKTKADVIISNYCALLLSSHCEHLLPLYAAQLQPFLRDDLLGIMLDERKFDNTPLKSSILKAMLSHLPLSGEGSVLSSLERFIGRKREVALESAASDWMTAVEQNTRGQVAAIEWLCLDPTPTIGEAREVGHQAAAAAAAAPPQGSQGQMKGGLSRLESKLSLKSEGGEFSDQIFEFFSRALCHGNRVLREYGIASIADLSSPTNRNVPGGSIWTAAAVALVGLLVDRVVALALLVETDSWFGEEDLRREIDEFQFWKDYFAFSQLFWQWTAAGGRQLQAADPVAEEDGKVLFGSEEEEELAGKAAERALRIGRRMLKEGATTKQKLIPEEEGAKNRWQLLIGCAMLTQQMEDEPGKTHGADGGRRGAVSCDAAVCALLAEKMLSLVDDDEIDSWHIAVEIRVHPEDSCLLDVAVRCLSEPATSAEGEEEIRDGAEGRYRQNPILTIIGGVAKAELPDISPHVALCFLRLEAFSVQPVVNHHNQQQQQVEGPQQVEGQMQRVPNPSLLRALTLHCCLPQITLRCQELRLFLAKTSDAASIFHTMNETDLVELVVDSPAFLHRLFTQSELEELVHGEQEAIMVAMGKDKSFFV